MGLYGIKPRFQKLLEPMVGWLVARRVNPDLLTFSALGISFIAAWCLYAALANRHLLLLVPPAVLARLTLNALDGQVARRTGKAGPLGEIKNEVSDRLADVAIFLGIGLGGYADFRLSLLALGIVLLIPFVGILGKAVAGERIYGGILGKPDRMLLLALFALIAWWTANLAIFDIYLSLIIVLGAITVGQRVRRILANIQSSG